MHYFLFIFLVGLFGFASAGWGMPPSSPQVGRLLFLIQQGEHTQALKLYQAIFQEKGQHDFEVLHQMGLGILDYGFRASDPESQLLALFGASVSAYEDAYYIVEESLKSRYPQIQLIAIEALARFQNDRSDQALLRALGSPYLIIRYEAVHQLCKKKHPHAVSQAESLMYKTPKALLAIYPPLFACVGDTQSTRILRRLLNHSSDSVRLAVILSAAEYERDDLLPQIRLQTSHLHFAQQEACAYALGILKDEHALVKLQKLSQSHSSTVALAAQLALYRLGQEEAVQAIEQAAQKEDLFAIAALGQVVDHPRVLLDLCKQANLQIRLNAVIALLEQHHPAALEYIHEVLIRDQRDLAFTSQKSPGQSLKAWKVTPSASQLFKEEDRSEYEEHLALKKSLLDKVRELSETHFITLAHQIFIQQQNDLVPYTVNLLEDLSSQAAIECLKQHQQQLGAPLVRNYCTLALYRLQEPGPYGEQLRQWIKTQSQTQLIRFKPFSPWEIGKNTYTITPEETSQLLITCFEAFAIQQDTQGIETLIEAMATGHAKNKYALAGLLLRATQ
jgi:HEAT repeat protein